MTLKKIVPASPDKALGKVKGDNAIARFAHINQLASQVDDLKANKETYQIPYGWEWYPEPTMIEMGTRYHYQPDNYDINGIKINSYKIGGMLPYSGSSAVSIYVGTLRMTPISMASIIPPWPGSIKGMVMSTNINGFPSSNNDITTTPLASGAMVWDNDAEAFITLNDVRVMLYPYEGNPNGTTGECNFAVVIEATGSTVTSDISSFLVNFEIEFLTSNYTKVELWQD